LPTLLPDLVWQDGAFVAGPGIAYDPVSGRIAAVVAAEAALSAPDLVRLPGRAVMPGFVNAHSHAFQRLLRGRTQRRPADAEGADFWTWRDAMYRIALGLSPDQLETVTHACYVEMLVAGYTSVGEFHYLHNDPAGRPYDDRLELAWRVVRAAGRAGIRVRLLHAAYATGGIDAPLRPEQRRFATPDLETYLLDAVQLIEGTASMAHASVGLAPHSVRAVPRAWFHPIHELAYGCDLPFHVHASEQPAEVAAAVAAWGRRPIEMLVDEGVVDALFTAVHATHVTRREIAALGTPGPVICACPTTERDLGDGMLPASELVAAGAFLALGSDSQAVIAPLEEARLLEYHERLRRLRRVVLGRARGDAFEAAPLLLDAATTGGARALRLPAGTLEAGALADFVAIDLEHPALAGCAPDTLAACLVFSAPPDVVSDVWVGGVQRVVDRRHPDGRAARQALAAVARAIPG
jgi:formimidoylglutamate deiminase